MNTDDRIRFLIPNDAVAQAWGRALHDYVEAASFPDLREYLARLHDNAGRNETAAKIRAGTLGDEVLTLPPDPAS